MAKKEKLVTWRKALQSDYLEYEVSITGRIRHMRKIEKDDRTGQKRIVYAKPLKPSYDKRGYATVGIYTANGIRKTYQVATLVMKTFTPQESWGKIIRHMDGDLSNNRLDNLEWVVPRGNSKRKEVSDKYLSIAGRLARKKLEEEKARKKREAAQKAGIPMFVIEDEKTGEKKEVPVHTENKLVPVVW